MPRAGVVHALLLLFAALAAWAPDACRATHNITAILAEHRDLAEFSRQLTATGLADEINVRNTITVLVVDDAHMAAKAHALPREALRHVLSLHVLVDYYDDAKLHRLPGGSAVVSTLFQASGDAPGSEGMVKIAVRRGGRVVFVPQDVEDNARADVFYVKSVHEAPYNISVLQVSAVITSPAAEAPSATPSSDSKPKNSTTADASSSKHGSRDGTHTAPSPAGQGASDDGEVSKQVGDGGDRGSKKNGAGGGGAPRGLPFALAFLMAVIVVVNW
uniref:FAS1 domain-containing protein n=1 Tax=Leersia perrieri TaxID=77586 RepID=A0A0D9VKH1_9ORYZ